MFVYMFMYNTLIHMYYMYACIYVLSVSLIKTEQRKGLSSNHFGLLTRRSVALRNKYSNDNLLFLKFRIKKKNLL